tara:strand:- start:1333 stop:1590 length:258 start_codon:yes stop_codon:yes gene_type:complete
MNKKPTTTAYLKINKQCFNQRKVEGIVRAGDFEWNFIWAFNNGTLLVEPPLGRALIKDALERFLVKADYKLESGGDYIFTVRAKF